MRPIVLVCLLAAACEGPAPITVTSDRLALTLRLDGAAIDLDLDGRPVLVGATADVRLADGSLVSMRDCTARYADLGVQTTPLGQPRRSELTCTRSALKLALDVDLYADRMTMQLGVTNAGDAAITVDKLTPLIADASAGGALYVGTDPVRHNILENGNNIALDQAAAVRAGDTGPFSVANAVPDMLRGNSISNWNHVVTDLDGDASLAAGWLTFEREIPTVGIAFDPKQAAKDGDRTGFTIYSAENALLWNGKPVAPGATLTSEVFYFDPATKDPLDAVERYAAAVKRWLGIQRWTERTGKKTPNGWNSWTGSDTTGGYGHAMTLSLWETNMQIAHDQLQPFGLEWFQLDDGWQLAYGDWTEDMTKFPGGLPAVAAADQANGLLPGVWVAPFWVDNGSQLAAQHPDLFAPPVNNIFGATASSKRSSLDLTNPAALAFVTQTGQKLAADGMKWVKADFTYWDLLTQPTSDPAQTNIEAYRAGMKALRAGLGSDPFLLSVAVTGTNYDLVDGMRVTLDNQPTFDPLTEDLTLLGDQGFKPTERTGARRYYLNSLWVNHEDLIFFRADTVPGVPPLTLDESIDFCTFVALTGGIVKMGDKLPDLTPPQLDVLRKLLPAYGVSGRPLDVFLREYPEMWHLPVAGASGSWDLVGVTHWGKNWDLTQRPIAAIADEDRTYHFDLAKLGMDASATYLAYEFWSETALPPVSGAFDLPVKAHHAAVVALRRRTGVPQLLGTNRHVTQGATDVMSERWDATGKTLTIVFAGVAGTDSAPFDYHLAVAAAGERLSAAHVTGVDDAAVDAGLANDVVDVRFRLPASATTTLTIVFQ